MGYDTMTPEQAQAAGRNGGIIRVYDDMRDMMVTHRYAAQDELLPLPAKGLLWYLLSKPRDWYININDLIASSASGASMCRTALKSLETGGYLRRTRLRTDDGQFVGWVSEVSALPIFGDNPLVVASPAQPKTPRREKTEVKKESSLHAQIMLRYGGTKAENYTDGLLGYAIPNGKREAPFAARLAEANYSVEQVAECYQWLKSQKWRTGRISLATVWDNIGEYVTSHKKAPQGYTPASALLDDDDDDQLHMF